MASPLTTPDHEWVVLSSPDGRLDPFDRVIDEMVSLNRSKRSDYAGDVNPWANFEDVGEQLGLSAGHAVEAQIANKQSRLKRLLFTGRTVGNEAVRDTLRDRAVYATIAVAIYDDGLYLC